MLSVLTKRKEKNYKRNKGNFGGDRCLVSWFL